LRRAQTTTRTPSPRPAGRRPGQSYAYTAQATDPENAAVSYSLISAPPGMTIAPTSGVIAWASNAAIGSYPISVRASDPQGAFSDQSYSLNVTALAGEFSYLGLAPLRESGRVFADGFEL